MSKRGSVRLRCARGHDMRYFEAGHWSFPLRTVAPRLRPEGAAEDSFHSRPSGLIPEYKAAARVCEPYAQSGHSFNPLVTETPVEGQFSIGVFDDNGVVRGAEHCCSRLPSELEK